MKYYLEDGACAPSRAHESDAGIDVRAMHTKRIPARDSAALHTGLHMQLPRGTAGLLVSKSGLNVNKDITSTGLIDEGYTGEIMVKLYNHGWQDYEVHAGDKISQLVVIPVVHVDLEQVDELFGVTERGADGFGSTGR